MLFLAGLDVSHLYLQNNYGVLLTTLPILLGPLPLGTLPPSGELAVPLVIPEMGAGIDAVPLVIQGALLPPGGGFRLSSAKVATLLDGSF